MALKESAGHRVCLWLFSFGFDFGLGLGFAFAWGRTYCFAIFHNMAASGVESGIVGCGLRLLPDLEHVGRRHGRVEGKERVLDSLFVW